MYVVARLELVVLICHVSSENTRYLVPPPEYQGDDVASVQVVLSAEAYRERLELLCLKYRLVFPVACILFEPSITQRHVLGSNVVVFPKPDSKSDKCAR